MKISAKVALAFWLAGTLLVAVGAATVLFVHHVNEALDQIRYDDSQIAQLAEAQAAISANPADAAAHLARLKDLDQGARTATEHRLLREAQLGWQPNGNPAVANRRLADLDTFYREAAAVTHEHLGVIHRRAVLCITVAVVDAAVLLAVLLFLVRYWLLKPIEELGEAADKIVTGDLPQPLVAEGTDEVDRLARDLNQLAAVLRDLKERVQKSERLATIGEACSFVAHNLRGPLASIQSLAAYESAAASVSPDAKVAFDHIVLTASSLERWVRDMVNSVRPFDLTLVRQPIEPIMQDALSLLQRRLSDRDIQVQVQSADDLADLPLDASLLEQALVSLLTNSVDASPKGGRITLSAANGPHDLTLAIQDEGDGMSEATQRKACEPFFTTKPNGAGLGLTIAKKIIELHGGRLILDSKPNQGTCVRISLPTGPANGQKPA